MALYLRIEYPEGNSYMYLTPAPSHFPVEKEIWSVRELTGILEELG